MITKNGQHNTSALSFGHNHYRDCDDCWYPRKESKISTFKMGVLGAVVGARAGYVAQKNILSEKSDEFISKIKNKTDKADVLTGKSKFLNTKVKNYSNKFEAFTAIVKKEQKVLKKGVAKAGLYGAMVFAGITIAGKIAKGLLSNHRYY